MAAAAIVLVGVVHGDPEGYGKLRRLLDRLRPPLVSVEISEFSWRYRRHWEARWRRRLAQGQESLPAEQRTHLALRRVAAQIACPFEARAAADYARERRVGWLAVDLSRPAREHLPRYGPELLSARNLRQLVTTPDGDWEDYIRQEYRRARRAWQQGQTALAAAGESLREKVLAHRVRRLAQRYKSVVHVGGWEHLVQGGLSRTMADYLTGWQPARVLLD